MAAGPSAEPALVTHEMVSLVGEGLQEIVLATPDPLSAWNAIAPHIQTAGLAVQARFSQPFMQTEAGRAFVEFATGVAHLAALAETWPATEGCRTPPRNACTLPICLGGRRAISPTT